MGIIGPGYGDIGQNNRIVTKTATGGTAALSERNSTIEFVNGAGNYAWTLPANVFPIGAWMILRKTGNGDITITKGAGVTFRNELFGNNNVKIDGNDGYFAYVEATSATEWLISGSLKS